MQWTIPGTVIQSRTEDAGKIRETFSAFFLAGDITLGQVSAISGLEPYMVQNWVSRKYLSNPQGKKYTLNQLCRVLTINLLRKSMPIENVCDLLGFVNGRLDQEGDDLIDDAEGIEKSVKDLPERIPGANERIQKTLQIMLYAWCAGFLRDRAEELMKNLEKE